MNPAVVDCSLDRREAFHFAERRYFSRHITSDTPGELRVKRGGNDLALFLSDAVAKNKNMIDVGQENGVPFFTVDGVCYHIGRDGEFGKQRVFAQADNGPRYILGSFDNPEMVAERLECLFAQLAPAPDYSLLKENPSQ